MDPMDNQHASFNDSNHINNDNLSSSSLRNVVYSHQQQQQQQQQQELPKKFECKRGNCNEQFYTRKQLCDQE